MSILDTLARMADTWNASATRVREDIAEPEPWEEDDDDEGGINPEDVDLDTDEVWEGIDTEDYPEHSDRVGAGVIIPRSVGCPRHTLLVPIDVAESGRVWCPVCGLTPYFGLSDIPPTWLPPDVLVAEVWGGPGFSGERFD